jgi:predicted O-linked N-acetylglucosamine transferase (SPINDLY family)
MTTPGAAADARAWLAEADRLHLAGDLPPAIAQYRAALARDPALFEAWYGIGFAFGAIEEYGEAVTALRAALALRPDAARSRVNLAQSLFALGHVSAAVREYQWVIGGDDEVAREMALRNLACIAPGDSALDNAAILHARRRWAEAVAVPSGESGWRTEHRRRTTRRPGEPLRIGYLSSFFGARNWMKMFMGVINAHDRDRFEVHLISDGPVPSADSGYRDHANDRIWDVAGVSNEQLAGHIADARLDVLIDLNGYCDPARMPVLAYRAAPVQLGWNGMYATTGFTTVDCVVGDQWTIPSAEERFYVERVHRVPTTYLAFDVFYHVPDVAPPPSMRNGFVTFGSLMSAYKVTDPVIVSWSRILRGVPGSRLLMRNRALGHASNRADLLARFAANGIEASRLALEGGGEHIDFLRTYDRIDIALDAFPYNGGTSTAEALWQGVPLLSFNGDRWASRTSRSILLAAGLGDWVAADQPGFEALAIRLGLAPEPLAAIRAGLRAKIAASPACDTAGLCRALEVIYQDEIAAKL